MLSRLVGDEFVRQTVLGNTVVTDYVSIAELPDAMIDPMVDIDLIKPFCQKSVFNKILESVINKKKEKKWNCGTCKKRLGKQRSIACESCLLWTHFTPCSQLNKKPTGDWFCVECWKRSSNGIF